MAHKWVNRSDVVIWGIVSAFFLFFALLNRGDIGQTFMASVLVVLIMFTIGISIEIIIETLRNVGGLGTVVGFITNGPEMVVLVVGFATGDILFGTSTPLGSNIMNPIMLVAAALVCGTLLRVLQTNTRYTATCLFFTVTLASVFYFLPGNCHWLWLAIAFIGTLALFAFRPQEPEAKSENPEVPGWLIIPAILLLLAAGFFLDPAVEFAADVSKTPKGWIGFVVLAALSSWPEFKSCCALLRRGRVQAAGLNIFVSNITNIWLAIIGIFVHLLLRT